MIKQQQCNNGGGVCILSQIFPYCKCLIGSLRQLTTVTRKFIKEIDRKSIKFHQNCQALPDNLRLYGSVTNRTNLQQKCWPIQSLELTKSSANAVESNADISEYNSLAFSFPILDAMTRNWASSAASRAWQTVTERILW